VFSGYFSFQEGEILKIEPVQWCDEWI